MTLKKFEDFIQIIDREIYKRHYKWQLSIISWMDFDDVAQLLRIHIHKKWHLYDQKRPLEPWINIIISSQIKNLIRNNYGHFCRPCLKCPAAEGEDLCSIYSKQCSDCPLYARWEKNKKQAYNVKLPVSLEHHSQEVFNSAQSGLNLDREREDFDKKLKLILTPMEYKFYNLSFVEQMSDQDVGYQLSFKKETESISAKMQRFQKIKKSALFKVEKALKEGTLEIPSYA